VGAFPGRVRVVGAVRDLHFEIEHFIDECCRVRQIGQIGGELEAFGCKSDCSTEINSRDGSAWSMASPAPGAKLRVVAWSSGQSARRVILIDAQLTASKDPAL
jgi:hypothetical protein